MNVLVGGTRPYLTLLAAIELINRGGKCYVSTYERLLQLLGVKVWCRDDVSRIALQFRGDLEKGVVVDQSCTLYLQGSKVEY